VKVFWTKLIKGFCVILKPMKAIPTLHITEKALGLLADIAVQRVEFFAAGKNMDISSWYSDERWQDVQLHIPVSAEPLCDLLLPMIALAPHLQPGFYEGIISRALPQGGDFAEFGGIKGQHHRGMLPTGETALFVLFGLDMQVRIEAMARWQEEKWCMAAFVKLEKIKEEEPAMSGTLLPDPDWMEKLLFGHEAQPVFSASFPAKKIQTPMQWNDLVLHPKTMEQVNDIRLWMEFNSQILADSVLKRKIKPGYRVLFYGPSGTGKTLTASLLGNEFNLPVYRIDLSQVVSKYIGETEKNLENIFARASRKNWILFFDEADALFGKRTSVSSAHDKYANQEVSYLLQRIEEHEGLLILASNYKNNIDDAFLRRFHSIIHFPMPGLPERLALWQGSIPASIALEENMDWQQIANTYELSGAAIVNVIQYAGIRALSRADKVIKKQDIVDGIRREFRKEEKNM
jgi:hypothetical protein